MHVLSANASYRRMLLLGSLVMLLSLFWLAVSGLAQPLYAADITVNTTNDEMNSDGDCSLREAVASANSNSAVDNCVAGNGSDTILLAAQTYTLSVAGRDENSGVTGDLDLVNGVGNKLTLQGAGMMSTTIDANGVDRALDIILDPVAINDLTITNGRAEQGGGVRVQSPVLGGTVVTITNVLLTGNQITGTTAPSLTNPLIIPDGGGGLLNLQGRVTLINSAVADNQAIVAGAGIGNLGIMVVLNSKVTTNTVLSGIGGGIASAGALYIQGGTVSDNKALDTYNIYTNSLGTGGGIFSIALVPGGGQLTLQDTTVSNNEATYAGGGIRIDHGMASINNTKIHDNQAGRGGGLGIYGGQVSLTDSEVFGNRAITNVLGSEVGGGIENDEAVLTLTNVDIYQNSAVNSGGGVANYASASNQLTIIDSLIMTNSAMLNGGGLMNAGKVSMTGGQISDNHAGGGGGGINNERLEMKLDGVEIVNNSAVLAGGGIWNGAWLEVTDSLIQENTAELTGGGIRNRGGSLSLSDSEVLSNTAPDGGGIAVALTNTTQLDDVVVAGNQATGVLTNTGFAGGIDIDGSQPMTISLNNVTIANNSAKNSCGGLYNGNLLDVMNSTITNNNAQYYGGGLCNNGLLDVTNSTITNNSANFGGGIYNVGGLSGSGVLIQENSAVGEGGGLMNVDGVVELSQSQILTNTAFEGAGVFALDSTNLALAGAGVSAWDSTNLAFEGAQPEEMSRHAESVITARNQMPDHLTFTDVWITGNLADFAGGGVSLDGATADFEDVTIAENEARLGGGLASWSGAAQISHITFSANDAYHGGAIYNVGELSLSDSLLVGNSGYLGAVIQNHQTMAVTDTIITNNLATYQDDDDYAVTSVIYNGSYSDLSFEHTTIGDNISVSSFFAAATMYNAGRLYLDDTTLVDNWALGTPAQGGALFNDTTGTAELFNSTVSGNQAEGTEALGGGLYNRGKLDVIHSTIADNDADGAAYGVGGGLYQAGFGESGSYLSIVNSIVADNSSSDVSPDCAVVEDISVESSLIGDTENCFFDGSNNILDRDPSLGELTNDNGAWVHPLLDDSIAINQIAPAAGDCGDAFVDDQTGFARPTGAGCDMGAYESEVLSAPVELSVATDGDGHGDIYSDVDGIYCPANYECGNEFAANSVVELVASPDFDSSFVGWSGACSGDEECIVTMDVAKHITASFALDGPPVVDLTVIKAGNGSGMISSDPNGIACGNACTFNFEVGNVVTLTPVADLGSTFVGWSGACSGAGLCVVTMDDAKSVAATFNESAPATYTLMAIKLGNGSISSNPAGIDCGATCADDFATNTQVTLNAVAEVGSTFVGWSGACSGTSSCVVTMSEAKLVSALFASTSGPTSFALTVLKAGNGSVTNTPNGIDCGLFCLAAYAQSTVVTLNATPAANSTFEGWSGACSGTGSCVVTMDAAKSVLANFVLKQYSLTVEKLGNGSIRSDVGGIDCGPTCILTVVHGSRVTLTAIPDAGYVFVGWSGACSGTGVCEVTIADVTKVSALFALAAPAQNSVYLPVISR